MSISPRDFFISYTEIRQIMAIGIPASITNLMQSFGMALMNRFLIPYGYEKVAAMGIVMKVNMIAVLILVGFAFGAQPLIGYNYGARNTARLRKILNFCYGFECCAALIFSVLLYIAAPALISWFIEDMSIVFYGVPMLRMQQIGTIFVAIVLVTTCTFQSAGKAWGAFLLSVSRQGVMYILVILLASSIFGYNGVIISQSVSDIFTAIIAVVLFRKGIYHEIYNPKKRNDFCIF